MPNETTWLGISKEEIEAGLRERGHTTLDTGTGKKTDKVPPSSIDRIVALNSDLRENFRHWWLTHEIRNSGLYHGYDLEILMRGEKGTPKMTPIGAFLALDWIIREPEKALASFERGYDSVSLATPKG